MNLHDEIAKIAYELYEKSGRRGGRDFENWRDAERIVLMRHASQDIEEPEGEEPMSMDQVLREEVEEKGRKYAGRKIEEKAPVLNEIDVREPALASAEDIAIKSERIKPAKAVDVKKKGIFSKMEPKSRKSSTKSKSR